MTDYSLVTFISDCEAVVETHDVPSNIVKAITPLMHRLLCGQRSFLKPEHFQCDPNHYARNLVYATDSEHLSLFTLVWEPGQWTPVHDHGTWGVVGVVEGLLEEQNYMRLDADQRPDRHQGIDLRPGGLVLLAPGSVSTFVPNPDHIHQTGCASDRPRCVSLHLYGRMMNSFYAYDVAGGTRTLIEAAHRETRLGKQDTAT